MIELGAWLRSLNLEQYEAALRRNDVDADMLASLTAEDLREIGVTSVGHRRRLLEAIGDLRARAAPDTADPAPGAPTGTPAERRRVTVLFSDLVDSNALAARVDPEDLRAAMATIRTFAERGLGLVVLWPTPGASPETG